MRIFHLLTSYLVVYSVNAVCIGMPTTSKEESPEIQISPTAQKHMEAIEEELRSEFSYSVPAKKRLSPLSVAC